MDTILSINHISHSYHTLKGETPALYDISFSVNQGAFLAGGDSPARKAD